VLPSLEMKLGGFSVNLLVGSTPSPRNVDEPNVRSTGMQERCTILFYREHTICNSKRAREWLRHVAPEIASFGIFTIDFTAATIFRFTDAAGVGMRRCRVSILLFNVVHAPEDSATFKYCVSSTVFFARKPFTYL
jgi:hypothetical protein